MRLLCWPLVSYSTIGGRSLRFASSTVIMASKLNQEQPQHNLTGFCGASRNHEFYGPYHDKEYGFPIRNNDDDNALFERLILEISQAGLSWLIVLKKRDGMKEAYDDFHVDTVANYSARDIERLRNDERVIRNKLKIAAAIYNAQRIVEFRKTKYGSFQGWLDNHHPLSKQEWVKLFKKNFRFTGGEITKEFLVSLGYLPGAHQPNCPVYQKIQKENPPWMSAPRNFDWEG